jgi:hypothetical protein
MKNLTRQMVWLGLALSLAVGSVAQRLSIKLPPDNPVSQIKPGPGDEAVRKNCIVCHSTDYIVRQPRLDAQHWEGEVKKMVNVFGARITDSDVKIIADYLTKYYGSEQTASEEKRQGGKR